ncbi:MAG: YifB family Mg chelatase-like AAA ATPase, partial [Bacteroidaceae bacterium]|nr:YifB family Mg chelatase-like AAA ATPase [Bacteroidaceae bacterium]
MLSKVYGASVQGIEASTITIEVDASRGIKFFLVGLPDVAVRESHERIMTSITQAGIKLPTRQIVINMAPADIKKEGTVFDLPLAIGILAATEVLDVAQSKLNKFMIMGELGLDGTLQPIRCALTMALKAKREGFVGIVLPKVNAREAAVVGGLEVYGVESLSEVIDFFRCDVPTIEPTIVDAAAEFAAAQVDTPFDFADVKGQESVKRAMEVAASGGHNLIMIGPPGAGKSMMAKRLPGILPPLSLAESLETTQIHSIAGKIGGNTSLISQRPFRSPHHTISQVALVGGGGNPQPGEISHAHNGVLFLDELPELSRTVLEVLRQPLED